MKTFKYKPALFLRIFTNMKTFKHNTFEIGSRNIIAFNDKPTISKNSGAPVTPYWKPDYLLSYVARICHVFHIISC